MNDTQEREEVYRYIKSLGGEGILNENDVPDLKKGRGRVLALMSDFGWHTRAAICTAAKQAEGQRRCRELRKWFTIRCRRASDDRRVFWYQLAFKDEPPLPNENTQLELF